MENESEPSVDLDEISESEGESEYNEPDVLDIMERGETE
jgi:hypothetical protein